MKRAATVLLGALAGTMLFDTWLWIASGFQSEFLVVLALLPFLAGQAGLLYKLHRTQPFFWSLLTSTLAAVLAVPGGVAMLAPRMLFNWSDWNIWVLPAVWELKAYFAAFLIVPPLVMLALRHLRSNHRWGGRDRQ